MASKQAFSKLQTKNSTQTLSICFMLLALVVPCYCAPASSGKHLHSAAAAVKDTSDADDSGRLTSGHVTRSSHYHPGYTVSFIEDGDLSKTSSDRLTSSLFVTFTLREDLPIAHQDISWAELRFYRDVIDADDVKEIPSCQVHAYAYRPLRQGVFKSERIPIGEYTLKSPGESRWESLDVTPVLQDKDVELRNSAISFELVFSRSNLSLLDLEEHAQPALPFTIVTSRTLSHTNHLTSLLYRNLLPTLKIHVKRSKSATPANTAPAQGHVRTGHGSSTSSSSTLLDAQLPQWATVACQLREVNVNINTFRKAYGVQAVTFLTPDGTSESQFKFRYCSGHCRHVSHQQRPLLDALRLGSSNQMGPCCVPSSFSSLTYTVKGEGRHRDEVKVKVMKDILADSCTCL